jgi:HK97 family phage portal protein
VGLFARRRAERTLSELEVRHAVPIGGDGRGWASYYPGGGDPADLGAMTGGTFRGSSVVYRCVQMIAANAGRLDLQVLNRDVEPVDGHTVAELFNRRPNPDWSARTFKELLFARLELAGETFVYVDRGASGNQMLGLWPVFDRVEVVIDDRGNQDTLLGYRLFRGRRVVPLLPDELLWLRYPHPDQRWGAQAPLYTASFAAELDAYAKAWQAAELRRSSRTAGLLFLGDVSEDVVRSVTAQLEARHSGPANAGRWVVVGGEVPARADRTALSPAEMSYIDSRVRNLEEIAVAFGVPVDLLAGRTTYENRRSAKVELWTETIVPKLEVVAGEVDRQLLPDDDETAAFDTSRVDALQENQDAVYGRVARVTYADVLTIDEGRAAIGLDPLPGGAGQQTLSAYRAQFRAAAAGGTPEARAALTAAVEARSRRTTTTDAAAVLRAYDRHEGTWQRALVRLAEAQQRVVMRNLDRKGRKTGDPVEVRTTSPDDLFDRAYWRTRTVEMLEDAATLLYEGGAAAAAEALGVSFDVFSARVLTLMHARLDTLAEQVTETTYQVLTQRLLDEGVSAGEGVGDLATRVRSVFTDLSTWRAETIARTEVVGGYNAASREVAVGSGQVQARQWLATSDGRTRSSHAELDGYTTNGLDDAYPNGLMHPGDPAGTPEQTVNCRCTEIYVLTDEEPSP